MHNQQSSGGRARSDQTQPDAIEFFWRPGCPYCASLKRQLQKRKIPLNMRNIWDDPAAAKTVRKAARGNETVPTIGIGGSYLVNPSADAVIVLLESKNPALAATVANRPKKRWGPRRR